MTPVQDFEAMISRRDGTQWVSKAITDMKNRIFDMVENSCEGDTYQNAHECLVALRKGCILEQVCSLTSVVYEFSVIWSPDIVLKIEITNQDML